MVYFQETEEARYDNVLGLNLPKSMQLCIA